MSTTENWGQEVGVETFWMSHLSDTCFDYNPLRIATHTIYHLVKLFVQVLTKNRTRSILHAGKSGCHVPRISRQRWRADR